jgi:hypothetical protein
MLISFQILPSLIVCYYFFTNVSFCIPKCLHLFFHSQKLSFEFKSGYTCCTSAHDGIEYDLIVYGKLRYRLVTIISEKSIFKRRKQSVVVSIKGSPMDFAVTMSPDEGIWTYEKLQDFAYSGSEMSRWSYITMRINLMKNTARNN